ncbi:hypothetical protein E2C01_029787 [Portunus trituberculatus]|uniref:Uncharacterized protein n=1 Tax=Portunus trituberculatus TaxID=210409 RepID=A0A5B7EQ91_PORTR|nr:hypothetical protein [Portunus trituberculatus]
MFVLQDFETYCLRVGIARSARLYVSSDEKHYRYGAYYSHCRTERDKEEIYVGKVVVQPCVQYTYLGSRFTADESTYSAVVVHAQSKMTHFSKFV